MAIDYGTKRTGLAVTDPLQIIANGLTTVHSKELMGYLKEYVNKENVDCIIVGMPVRLNGEDTDMTQHVVGFVRQLKKTFPQIAVDTIDERFTSKIAMQTMISGGLKKKDRQNKELVDKISATIILQSYMESKNNQTL